MKLLAIRLSASPTPLAEIALLTVSEPVVSMETVPAETTPAKPPKLPIVRLTASSSTRLPTEPANWPNWLLLLVNCTLPCGSFTVSVPAEMPPLGWVIAPLAVMATVPVVVTEALTASPPVTCTATLFAPRLFAADRNTEAVLPLSAPACRCNSVCSEVTELSSETSDSEPTMTGTVAELPEIPASSDVPVPLPSRVATTSVLVAELGTCNA